MASTVIARARTRARARMRDVAMRLGVARRVEL
jgi:hypothetical protein